MNSILNELRSFRKFMEGQLKKAVWELENEQNESKKNGGRK